MPSSGMLHHVALVRTNVFGGMYATIRVTKNQQARNVRSNYSSWLLITANVLPSSILATLMLGAKRWTET
jgi:hypothetical protein